MLFGLVHAPTRRCAHARAGGSNWAHAPRSSYLVCQFVVRRRSQRSNDLRTKETTMKRLLVALTITGTLAFAAQAAAHARVSPAVSLSGKLQLYSLAVPTEKDKLFTTKIVLTLP